MCILSSLLTLLFFTSSHARGIDFEQSSNLELASSHNTDRSSRITRQTYGSSDYYNNYYNDYYKNFYANQNRVNSDVRRPPPPPPPAPIRSKPTADRFDSNRNEVAFDDYDRNDNSQQQQQQQIYNGQRYVYTPIFQYKSTHGKHEKLFVPNIFG